MTSASMHPLRIYFHQIRRTRSDDSPFFNRAWQTLAWEEYFQTANQTTGIATMQHDRVRDFPIPFLLSLATRICLSTGAVEKLKTAQRASLAELDALFASLHTAPFEGICEMTVFAPRFTITNPSPPG